MKKKIVSTLLCTAMLVTMMAGCGGNNAANTSTNSGNSSSAAGHFPKYSRIKKSRFCGRRAKSLGNLQYSIYQYPDGSSVSL